MIMTTSHDLNHSPPTTPCTTPAYPRDRLLRDLSKYTRSPHATQLLPTYREYRMGQGDPLLKASIDYGRLTASGNSITKNAGNEIHLTDTGTLPGGVGMKDIVHIGKNEVIEFPCLPTTKKPQCGETENRESPPPSRARRVKQCSMPSMGVWRGTPDAGGDNSDEKPVDHLLEHGTTLAGLGMNDIVHVDKNTVISVPCVPTQFLQEVHESNPREEPDGKRRHSFPHIATKGEDGGQVLHPEHSSNAKLGMSDVIHILSGNDQVLVSLPVAPKE
jgi:hypothetical protein